MFKLDLEKAEEPEIKLPTSTRSLKKQEFQKTVYFCFIDYAKAFAGVTASAEPAHSREEGLDSTLNAGTSRDFQVTFH